MQFDEPLAESKEQSERERERERERENKQKDSGERERERENVIETASFFFPVPVETKFSGAIIS